MLEVKKTTLQNIGIAAFVLIILGILFFGFSSQPSNTITVNNTQTVAIEGDNQILNLRAKGGYNPSNITAKAGVNTLLRVTTSNTFDCSSSIRIPSLNIYRTLPSNGNTDISLGKLTPGSEIYGTCAMGMYSFTLKFT